MRLLYIFMFQLELMIICAKDYRTIELNRMRIKKLYRNNLLTRPSTGNTSQTTVAIGLGIIEVAGIDPHQQVITFNVNYELKWCDDLLNWNTSDQLCINRRNRSEIFFNARDIWTPDIVAINGPGRATKDVKYQYPVLIICTGNVRWSYQAKLTAFCEIDVRNFPFDHQHCSILLQSTIYDSDQLKLRSLYDVVRLYNFINTEWDIQHATIEEIDLYNPHYSRNFSTIKINIELARLSRFYVLKIILPFSVISSLALFSLCLPTDSGEKITFSVSVLLSLTIYLQIISDYVPKTERGICILTLYSNIIFSFVFVSCVFNIFTIYIYYNEEYHVKNKKQLHHDKSTLLHIHKSLLELNKQRRIILKKHTIDEENLLKQRCVAANEMLQDIQHIRTLLMKLLMRKNIVDYRHYLLHREKPFKKITNLMDRVLFSIYIVSMGLCILLLIKRNYQFNELSVKNQLLDLRKTSVDPMPRYRGCPT